MPNGDAFDDAVQLASQTPHLGVGIHFSLVGERCVAPPEKLKGLVDSQGQLPASYSSFARGYLTKRFTLDEIRRELDAQLQRVLEAGIVPTHVDSHQHVHILPGVFAAVLESIKGTGIGVVRVPREDLPGFRPTSRHLQLKVLTGLCRRANKQAHEAGLLVVDHFWGLEVSGALNENALLEIIAKTRPGVNEIMSHPGDSDAALHHKYAWGYNWDDEAKALQSLAVKQAIEARDIRLAHFGELLA